MQNRLFLHTRFSPTSPHAHGGVRRCLQLVELLESAGFSFANVEPARGSQGSPSRRRPAKSVIDRIRTAADAFPQSRLIASRIRTIVRTRRFRIELDRYRDSGAILWENTFDHFVPGVASSRGLRVVAAPQNLESLVMDAEGSPTISGLPAEVSALAEADKVFCISEEEAWLLRTAGIGARSLPYYPPRLVGQDLAEVRRRRAAHSHHSGWLLFGTVGNYPTRRGMSEVLRWLEQFASRDRVQVDVAGFGTEALRSNSDPASFRFHGSVSNEALRDLMTSCVGVIIHHSATGGAITRLVECALAGVPVVANVDATKGRGLPGVWTYRNVRDMRALLHERLPTPAPPERPAAEEREFVDAFTQQGSA